MWLIDQQPLIEPEGQKTTPDDPVFLAPEQLAEAVTQRNLTVIVGNGLSQCAAYLHSLEQSHTDMPEVGWDAAVDQAAIEVGVPKKYRDRRLNAVARAQSVFEQARNTDNPRATLLSSLNREFSKPIVATVLHRLLVDINPATIVTTNYDLLLERAFEEQNSKWRAVVRSTKFPEEEDGLTVIYKMHGTLKPDTDLLDRYIIPDEWVDNPEESVVISEEDYDKCLQELMKNESSPLLRALRRPCLIIGKGIWWQDLSFLYALRRTKEDRDWAYCLVPSLSLEEEHNLFNLNITPLRINMPTNPQHGHYFVGLAKALNYLLPEPSAKYEEQITEFTQMNNLKGAPHFVALGLAAHNTSGTPSYNNTNEMPPPGRRNFRFDKAEEYPGGSALTALGTFAALDANDQFHRSIIAAVGRNEEDRTFNELILKFCSDEKVRIDTDGLSPTADQTWRSMVIVHDVVKHPQQSANSEDDVTTPVIYRGQRLFLDRGFRNLSLSHGAKKQLRAQLDPEINTNLQLIYFDKFLAEPYPFDSRKDAPEELGILVRNRILLEKASQDPEIDILYETGGGGTIRQRVERALGPYINFSRPQRIGAV